MFSSSPGHAYTPLSSNIPSAPPQRDVGKTTADTSAEFFLEINGVSMKGEEEEEEEEEKEATCWRLHHITRFPIK